MRRLVAVGTPAAFMLVSLAHPRPDGANITASLAPQVGLWIAVHVAQVVLVALLGITVWLLIEDLPGVAAAVSRCALWLFVALYSAYDAIVGIGTGLLVRQAAATSGAEAGRLAQAFWAGRLDTRGPVLWVTLAADVAWLVAVLAAAAALRRAGAPPPALALLLVSGVAFAVDHPWPFGTIGMAALLGAAALLTAPARAPAPRRGR